MATMSNERLEPGLVLAGRFRIEGFIGEGGMGTIYKARHVKLPRTFALKLLKPTLAADADFVARFLREAVAASKVVHPGVVNVTDYGQLDDGTYYIAMEHLEGEGIDVLLEREKRLSLDRALDILIQLSDALDYCHELDIVHRDLKTDNILLCTIHGRRDVVKLVDFGIARLIGPELSQWQITQGGVIFGTPEYLSPERALDAEVDGRSDIYSLGIIAFELVTGTPPFTGKYTQILKAHISAEPPTPSSQLAQPLPPAYDALVLKCLAKKPEERFATCGNLLGELLRIRGSLAGGTHELGGSQSNGSTPQRPTTDGSWHSLAVRRPSTGAAPTSGTVRPEAAGLQALGEAVHLATEAAAIRTALRNILKDLAFGLGDQPSTPSVPRPGKSFQVFGEDRASRARRDEGAYREYATEEERSHRRSDPSKPGTDFRGVGLGKQLEQVLQIEGQSRSLSEELTLLAQQQLQLQAETDEYTGALRQLSLDLDAVAARDDPAADAYRHQRQAVAHHMDSLAEGRDRRSATVSQEIMDNTAAVSDHDTHLAQLYFALYAGVMALRGTDAASPLDKQYHRLDELQTQLWATWAKIG